MSIAALKRWAVSRFKTPGRMSESPGPRCFRRPTQPLPSAHWCSGWYLRGMSTFQDLLGLSCFSMESGEGWAWWPQRKEKGQRCGWKGGWEQEMRGWRDTSCLEMTRASPTNCYGNYSIEPEHLWSQPFSWKNPHASITMFRNGFTKWLETSSFPFWWCKSRWDIEQE